MLWRDKEVDMSSTAARVIPSLPYGAREGVAAFTRTAERRLDDDRDVTISIGDETATVPASVVETLLDVLDRLASGRGVVVSSVDDFLTTGQTARMLGVSRSYVYRLLDEDRLPFEYRGTHRRVRTADALTYLKTRLDERRDALDEVSRLSRVAGLYGGDEF
jgi:excisionase family DNA binding protein